MKKNFQTAIEVQSEEEATQGPVTLDFTIASNVQGRINEDLSAFEYHQTEPSTALFSVVASGAAFSSDNTEKAAAVWDYFKGTLPPEEYRHLRSRVIVDRDINFEAVMEVFEGTSEFWGAFPTKQSSVSSPSQTSTGPALTGRSPGAGSTRSR